MLAGLACGHLDGARRIPDHSDGPVPEFGSVRRRRTRYAFVSRIEHRHSAPRRVRRRSAPASPTPWRTAGPGPRPMSLAVGTRPQRQPAPTPPAGCLAEDRAVSAPTPFPSPGLGAGHLFPATRVRPVPPPGRPAGSSRAHRPSEHTLLDRAVSPCLALPPPYPQGNSTRPVPRPVALDR